MIEQYDVKRNEKSGEFRLKSIIFFLSLCISLLFIHIHADASTLTTFRSSDSKNSYYTLTLDQNQIHVEGITTEKVSKFDVYLINYTNSNITGDTFEGYTVNGTYNQTYYLPVSNKLPLDGIYEISIQLKDAQYAPFIIVKNGIASFYQSENNATDILSDGYIRSMNPKDILNTDPDLYNTTETNLTMSQSQSDELHQLALDITNGLSSDYEKAKAIYQWVTDHIYYDMAHADTASNGDNNPYSVYKNRYGVCEGYTRLLVELLRSIQIPAAFAMGDAQNPIYIKDAVCHAWAVIYADGRWFYADPTWDSRNTYVNKSFKTGDSTLKYFDISLDALAVSHHTKFIEANIIQNDFSIVFYNGEISVNSYIGTNSGIILPAKLNQLPITQVIGYFNKYCNPDVIEIIVPDGYDTLTGYAFSNYNSLDTLALPDTIQDVDSGSFYTLEDSIKIYCKNSPDLTNYCDIYDIYLKHTIPDFLDCKNFDLNSPLIDISNATVTFPNKITFEGSPVKPELSVSYNGQVLKQGTDYEAYYSYNDEPGTAIVLLYGMGKYIGENQSTFMILPKTVSIHLLSKKAGTVQINWKKSRNADGYQVSYANKKNGKYKKLKNTSSLRYTVTKLASGKNYYFKVRPYFSLYEINHYGAFSQVKEIKVK